MKIPLIYIIIIALSIGRNGNCQEQTTVPLNIETNSVDVYRASVAKVIQNKWVCPKKIEAESSLSATVVFIVLPDGRIKDIWFDKESGHIIFDESIMKAIYKTKLPAFSDDIAHDKIFIGLTFSTGECGSKKSHLDKTGDIDVLRKYRHEITQIVNIKWNRILGILDELPDTQSEIILKIYREGKIDNIQFMKRSTHKKFNDYVLQALNTTKDIPVFPDSVKDDYIFISLMFCKSGVKLL